MHSCDSPFTPVKLSQMHRTQSHGGKAKLLKRKKGFLSSVKGISHLSRHAKRRLCCKLQLWMWRKQRENCRFRIFRLKKRACGSSPSPRLSVKTQSQGNKTKDPMYHTPNLINSVPPLGCDAMPAATMPTLKSEPLVQPSEITHSFRLSHTVKPLSTERHVCGLTTHFNEPRTPAQKPEVSGPAGQVTPGQSQAPNSKKSSQTDVSLLTNDIHEFLDGFYRIYGSFIPLQKGDVFRHLKRKFNTDFSDRKNFIFSEVFKHRAAITQKPVPSFQVVYKKHTLTLDDLSTLADQNWLNDQVMNMYGDLIMESAHHKVHFLNSFFHKQLMTKGYEGVKRWTKQVDLFSKSLLLVPVHLEVHWCLVTADIIKKKICLYDSQGNALQKVARNVLKYLMTEAKEKKQTHFLSGWMVSFNEIIPQQTNENDCGVFVLEYSRCLALEKPLQFSQKDIPKIRKRIYKELCDCKLHEQG